MIIFWIADKFFVAESEELKNRDLGFGLVSRRAGEICVRHVGVRQI
jgi:hypothetical protein